MSAHLLYSSFLRACSCRDKTWTHFCRAKSGINICVDDMLLKGRSYINQSKSVLLSADVGKTSDLVAYWRLTFTDCNQTQFCCQFWLHSLYSWWLWWFYQLCQWFLPLMRTIWSDTHDLVGVGERKKQKKNWMLLCAMLSQFEKRGWKNRSAQLLCPNRSETAR